MSVRLLSKQATQSRKLRTRVGFSWQTSVVGVPVVGGYAALVVWMFSWRDFPAFMLWINVATLAFFALYWARHTWRLLRRARPFALATSDNALLVPLAPLDRAVPDTLDKYLEIPFAGVVSVTWVRLSTSHTERTGNERSTVLTHTPILRIALREDLGEDVTEAMRALRRHPGFQGVHARARDARTLEVFFARAQRGAVDKALAAWQLRAIPVETERIQLGELSGEAAEDVIARLEDAGHTTRERIEHPALEVR